MTGLVATFAILTGLLHPHPPAIHLERHRLNGWTLEVRRDTFAKTSVCTARRGAIALDHGVVTFHFSHRIDTRSARYRVDGGDLVSARSVAVEAAGLGAALGSRNLSNPSDGQVHIPMSHLDAAKSVTIQATPGGRPRTYSLEGLGAVRAEVRAQGCGAT